MSAVALPHYLTVAVLLFSIGIVGVLTRRNAVLVLLSIELILNSANLSFVAFSAFRGDLSGQVVVFFTMIVAAAEVTVGLSIVVLMYRKLSTISIDALRDLKW